MALTLKDKVEQFKRDCRSMEYWTKCYIDCCERLEEIATHLHGVSSPRMDDVILENAGDPYKNGKLYWFHEETKVIQERSEYERNMTRVNMKLIMIANPMDQQLIRDLYIERKNHEQVADRYHMNRQNMYKKVDRILEKIV